MKFPCIVWILVFTQNQPDSLSIAGVSIVMHFLAHILVMLKKWLITYANFYMIYIIFFEEQSLSINILFAIFTIYSHKGLVETCQDQVI